MVTWLADRERITPITAVRILYRPLEYVNLISQRIFREKALVPAKLRKSIETGALISFAMVIPLLAFVVFVVPLLWLLSPAIITIVAAMLCLRVAHTGILEYVGVTALTDADVIKGLVSGVLARLEYWTLAVTVIVPLVLLAFIAPAAGLVMTHGDLDDGLYGLAAQTAMSDLLEQIIALIEQLDDRERGALLAYLQELEGGRVFLCQTERNIFLSAVLKDLADGSTTLKR